MKFTLIVLFLSILALASASRPDLPDLGARRCDHCKDKWNACAKVHSPLASCIHSH